MIFPERYSKQMNLRNFGVEAQQKLHSAKVLVVGAGGLGVPALQYLAAAGIGIIGIVDGDTINITNLNRQVLYNQAEVGLAKAVVASTKLQRQNPSIQIEPLQFFLSPQNALDIVRGYDLVIDATDNFAARYLINDACIILGKPFIYGAIQEYEGHVSLFNYLEGPTYRCLYPEPPSSGEIPDCNTAGVLGVVPGIIGCQQALEAIKVITGVGKTSSGYLRIFDFLNNDQYEVRLKTKSHNRTITRLQESYELRQQPCTTIPLIKVAEVYDWLVNGKDLQLLDVREKHEFEQGHLPNALFSPLSTFSASMVPVVSNVPVIVYCEKGARSGRATMLLQDRYPGMEVFSLDGGIETWQKELGKKLFVI